MLLLGFRLDNDLKLEFENNFSICRKYNVFYGSNKKQKIRSNSYR